MKNNNHLKEEPLFAIGKIAKSNNVRHYKTIGTIEPYSGDNINNIPEGFINDVALSFIYGAIKKYGNRQECYEELKDYIKNEINYIGK